MQNLNLTNEYAHTAVTSKVVTQKRLLFILTICFIHSSILTIKPTVPAYYAVQYENKEWGNKTIHSKLRGKKRWYMIHHTTRAIVGQHASQPIKLLHFHRILHGVKQKKMFNHWIV